MLKSITDVQSINVYGSVAMCKLWLVDTICIHPLAHKLHAGDISFLFCAMEPISQ